MTTSPWPRTVDGVLLRYPTAEEVETLLRIRSLPETNRWMLYTQVDPDRFRENFAKVPESTTEFSCAAVLDGEVVGLAYLDLVDGMGQPGMPRGTVAEIGYLVDPEHAGKGVATRMARGTIAAAFEDLGALRVTAGCYADNVASYRVLEKAGMRREQHGVQDSWHDELGWVDGYTYALLADEWRRRQEAAGH